MDTWVSSASSQGVFGGEPMGTAYGLFGGERSFFGLIGEMGVIREDLMDHHTVDASWSMGRSCLAHLFLRMDQDLRKG